MRQHAGTLRRLKKNAEGMKPAAFYDVSENNAYMEEALSSMAFCTASREAISLSRVIGTSV